MTPYFKFFLIRVDAYRPYYLSMPKNGETFDAVVIDQSALDSGKKIA